MIFESKHLTFKVVKSFEQHLFFSTFTVERWGPVFADFPYTNTIVLESFSFLVKRRKVNIYSFVIMKDHIHILWKVEDERGIQEISRSFKSHTASKILAYIKSFDPDYLSNYYSKRKDRDHKFWKLKSMHVELESKRHFKTILNYIHKNPTKGNYKSTECEEEYIFSSAKAYYQESINFDFLEILEGI